jgi:hypothetical protein
MKTDPLKPRIQKEVIIRYYVIVGDWIYAGPFEKRSHAVNALNECKWQQAQEAEQIKPTQ